MSPGVSALQRQERLFAALLNPLGAATELAATADFFCYWLSATGHGGPEVSAPMLERIASFNASLGFDYYGPYDDSVGVSS